MDCNAMLLSILHPYHAARRFVGEIEYALPVVGRAYIAIATDTNQQNDSARCQ